MFDQVQDKFSRALQNLKGQGKVREGNIEQAIEDVRKSLLDADVHYRAVQSFIDSVKAQALGENVLTGVHPGEQFIKILYDELVKLLGDRHAEIEGPMDRPWRIMLVGLQGSGKTTTASKLAKHLRDERRRKPLLVPLDLSRPAAKDQLKALGEQIGVPVYEGSGSDPVSVASAAIKAVDERAYPSNTLIFDTAGRLAIDANLMDELKRLKTEIQPDAIVYVLDGMAGQDALNTAKAFLEDVDFDGVIVSKTDGDARGGAALSVRWVLDRPILFLGVSEKPDGLSPVFPDRLASRILGMGDVVGLVERVQQAFDEDSAKKLAKKLRKNQFTIEDFYDQLQAMKKMGSMSDVMGMIPGMGKAAKKMMAGGMPEKMLKETEVIIQSMTLEERRNPQVINGQRRKRIALGSGKTVMEVNRFMKQYLQAKTMMSRLQKSGIKGMQRGGFF